jgi:hypothetical protein
MSAVAIALRDGNRCRSCQDWRWFLVRIPDHFGQSVGGVLEQFFLKNANLRYPKSIPGMYRHHVDAGVRVTR